MKDALVISLELGNFRDSRARKGSSKAVCLIGSQMTASRAIKGM